ncbi:unnamed protein product [Parascedosporium putredinis]|uniref:Uncharacterized protein n=1 Tax=Parascedosporium putredinis TaxID=1442378 RepID=A0A9P1HC89_9PEZI|nr:unnamed protein product [Parascedosporium putredinis]CAI8004512.1 unnamed protein product [Parascedosporium putredinis]
MADKRRVDSLAVDFLLFAGLLATGAYVIRQVISNVIADPEREKHEQASLRAKAHLERLQRENDRKRSADNGSEDASQRGPRVEDLALNQYENIVAMDMVASQDIHVGFNGESVAYRRLEQKLAANIWDKTSTNAQKFAVALPGAEQRRRILQLVLSDTKTDPEEFNLDYIVKVTAGMSGSDLRRHAAMQQWRQ